MQVQSAVDLKTAKAFRERLLKAKLAENTVKGYEFDWKLFVKWCSAVRRSFEPASAETLALYVSSMLADGKRVTTAERRMSAVLFYHKEMGLPVPSMKQARVLLTSGKRMQCGQSKAKAALSPELLLQMVRKCNPLDQVDIRNRAIVLIGFATAMRRCELVSIQMQHLTFEERGLAILQPRSKVDQLGAGRFIGVFPGDVDDLCPIRALRSWLLCAATPPARCSAV